MCVCVCVSVCVCVCKAGVKHISIKQVFQVAFIVRGKAVLKQE